MMVLVTYDVDFTQPKGAKRLRKVAKLCERYGVRVQNSVFEMLVDPAQLAQIKVSLSEIIDMKADSVRFYRFGSKWETKIETMGLEKGIRQDAPLIL
jgi:CRISPR-associated protein Cas2